MVGGRRRGQARDQGAQQLGLAGAGGAGHQPVGPVADEVDGEDRRPRTRRWARPGRGRRRPRSSGRRRGPRSARRARAGGAGRRSGAGRRRPRRAPGRRSGPGPRAARRAVGSAMPQARTSVSTTPSRTWWSGRCRRCRRPRRRWSPLRAAGPRWRRRRCRRRVRPRPGARERTGARRPSVRLSSSTTTRVAGPTSSSRPGPGACLGLPGLGRLEHRPAQRPRRRRGRWRRGVARTPRGRGCAAATWPSPSRRPGRAR